MRALILTMSSLVLMSCGADCECGSNDTLVWRWQWGKYTVARECKPCLDFEVR